MTSLEAIIRELGRAAARARGARYAVHALVAALAWIALVLVIARLTPFEGRALVAAVGIPIVLVIALLAWLIRRPTAQGAAFHGVGAAERVRSDGRHSVT